MKNTTFISVILVIMGVISLNAQTSKGKVIIGISSAIGLGNSGSNIMTLGFSNIKYKSDNDVIDEIDSDKQTSFNLAPSVGYLIMDNFALGLDLNIASSTFEEGADNYTFRESLFSVGPFVRYYIPVSKVSYFIETGIVFGALTQKLEYSDPTTENDEWKSSVTSFHGGIGIAAPLGERVFLDVGASYYSTTLKDNDDNKDNTRSVISTFGLKLGFTILLGKNEKEGKG